jgi:hypothetical protein
MSKIKIVIAMDGDGHFQAALRNNRHEVIEVLKSAQDGQYYDDVVEDYELNMKDPWHLKLDEWSEVVDKFIQRGTIEVIEI